MTSFEHQKLLTIDDVRDILQISATRFKRLRAEGLFPDAAVNLGKLSRPRLQRWTSAQIENWLTQQSQQVAA